MVWMYSDMLPLAMVMMLMPTLVTVADGGRTTPEVDLNCREDVSLTSDSDGHSDDGTIENKVFPQQRFSPVTTPMHPAALPPRPVRFGSGVDATATSPVVRPSASTPAFHPRGDVFKARASQLHNSSGKPDMCCAVYDVRCSFSSALLLCHIY